MKYCVARNLVGTKSSTQNKGVVLMVRALILYSRKLSREKTFANLEVLWLFTKVFSAKIIFSTDSQKVSPVKVFSHKSCSLYGMLIIMQN